MNVAPRSTPSRPDLELTARLRPLSPELGGANRDANAAYWAQARRIRAELRAGWRPTTDR